MQNDTIARPRSMTHLAPNNIVRLNLPASPRHGQSVRIISDDVTPTSASVWVMPVGSNQRLPVKPRNLEPALPAAA